MHKGIYVDGYEVVLLSQDALYVFDQPLALSQVETGLMFGPWRFDPWLADKGGWAAAYGVNTYVGLGATGPWVNVLYDGSVARVALATLGDLGAEDRPLQGLDLAPNANGTQVSEDA